MTLSSGNNDKKKLLTQRSLTLFGLGKITNEDAKITFIFKHQQTTQQTSFRCCVRDINRSCCVWSEVMINYLLLDTSQICGVAYCVS